MTNYILPVLVLIIILYSYNKCNVYDSFIKGCKEGLNTSINLFISILGILFSIKIFINSGIIDYILNIISPLLKIIKFPKELFPILILKPLSASSVLVFMIDIFNKYGIDSKISLISSVIYSVTDTSIYIISMYLGLLKINNSRYLYKICILINILSVIISIIVVNLLK